MSSNATLTAQQLLEHHLASLRLSRLGENREAGLWITSLPWPRAASTPLSLEGQTTACEELGQWPCETTEMPRRLLLIADGENRAPDEIGLQSGAPSTPAALPEATMELIASCPHEDFAWERHFLRVEHEGRAMGLVLGLRVGEEVHWWEACRVVEVERSTQCLTLEMGGAIPCREMDIETFRTHEGLTNPFLHKHNWINGHLRLRLHANGVCEVFARHINSKFFDDGGDFEDAVPVVGFRLLDDAVQDDASTLLEESGGAWDGTRATMQLGEARFDLEEAARLATPAQPGRLDLDLENQFLVWQPYQGFELFGGICPQQLIGDEFILRAEQHKILRGMARTLRFSFSLSQRSPRIARYLAPAWWYGVCEEFSPAPYLPISNVYDDTLEQARRWVRENIVQRGFEDGSVPRNASCKKAATDEAESVRCEPGWEGEIPYAQFLAAWRSGGEEDYQSALRSAYHFTDLAIDHSAKIVRMHGYPPHAFALPMARLQGTIAAYLETGDRFLLETAEAVTTNAFWLHKNSWPRHAVGRDACFIRSAVLLYRYFGNEYFRRLAYEGIQTVAAAQRANGSFGDQGGGTGIHQWGGYITKPWMAMLATGGVLDYWELFPDEELCATIARKAADWLMSERVERDGVLGWCYQHEFKGGRTYFNPFSRKSYPLPDYAWHQENIGRLMLLCTQRFGDASYTTAWAESRATKRGERGDHYISSVLQFIPWVQDHLWRAKLTEDGISTDPTDFGPLTPNTAIIQTPTGRDLIQTE
jgi:hypothetical protein